MQLKMKVGLSGPEISLAPGDVQGFDDHEEAQRLIDAGFAELFVDEPAAPVEPAAAIEPAPPAVPPVAPAASSAPRAKAPKKTAAPTAGA